MKKIKVSQKHLGCMGKFDEKARFHIMSTIEV